MHDKEAHQYHLQLAKEYHDRLKQELKQAKKEELERLRIEEDQQKPSSRRGNVSRQKLNFDYELTVVEDAKWDFPILKYRENDEPFVPRFRSLVPSSKRC